MICLSFDSDHMSESRMAEFLGTVPVPGEATFFCTQRYACLDATGHELAPHPTLRDGEAWEPELRAKREEFPEARGWRAHSCVFSHLLAEWLAGNGYRYVSSHDQFGCSGVVPVRHVWGVWHLPIYYMDNMDFSRRRFWGEAAGAPFDPVLIERALADDGVYVFDFHPIHLLLNTPEPEFYFRMRDRFRAGEPIEKLRHEGVGAGSFYGEVCRAMQAAGVRSVTMERALDAYLDAPRLEASTSS